MKIVADENIPFAREAFSPFGDVTLLPGRAITPGDLRAADVLLVRSVTRVDRTLLDRTPVRFVGTATIGVDHIDTAYLAGEGIEFADAAGSNSRSVAEYVVAALLELCARGAVELEGARIGVVGVGRIGALVMEMARALGMNPVGYDPPRARRDGFASATLDELLGCPVITFHVPLIGDGDDPTFHVVDRAFLEGIPDGAVLVNTSRGAVIDSMALAEWLRAGRGRSAVLDVWEGEPDIPADLIDLCALATPHIAGYSLDGKLCGTAMLADALARVLPVESIWNASEAIPTDAGVIRIPPDAGGEQALAAAVSGAYDILADDAALRVAARGSESERKAGFDRLRKGYRVRREFPAWRLEGAGETRSATLASLGFRSG